MVDFSETHLLNENWSSHARTHVAWLLATNFLTSMLSLYFLWMKNLKFIPILFISSIIAGYFISILTKDSYGGSISEIGGVALGVVKTKRHRSFFNFSSNHSVDTSDDCDSQTALILFVTD